MSIIKYNTAFYSENIFFTGINFTVVRKKTTFMKDNPCKQVFFIGKTL